MGTLVCGTGERRVGLQRLGDLAVAVRHIAVAGFEFGAALGQLFVGKLDVHRTVRDINVNDVAVLDQAIGPLFAASGAIWPMARPEEPPE